MFVCFYFGVNLVIKVPGKFRKEKMKGDQKRKETRLKQGNLEGADHVSANCLHH